MGYAAVFNQPTELRDKSGRTFTEVIRSGAFSQSLTNDVWFLVDHEKGKRIARSKSGALTLQEDAHGLRFEATLPDTARARDLAEEIRAGLYGGMSFGAKIKRDKWAYEKTPTRELQNLDLAEISIVYDPAYSGTSVALRSLDCIPDLIIPDLANKRLILNLIRSA